MNLVYENEILRVKKKIGLGESEWVSEMIMKDSEWKIRLESKLNSSETTKRLKLEKKKSKQKQNNSSQRV